MAVQITIPPDNYIPPVTLPGIAVVWKGDWSSAFTYYKDQAVYYNGSSYRANKTTTSTPFEASLDWDLIARKGGDGDNINIEFAFSYSDPSLRLIYTIAANNTVVDVDVIITETFNGTGTLIKIGDIVVPNRLADNSTVYINELGTYSTHPYYTYGSVTNLYLDYTAGSGGTQGKGIIYLNIK